jgi:hypothetical protein
MFVLFSAVANALTYQLKNQCPEKEKQQKRKLHQAYKRPVSLKRP